MTAITTKRIECDGDKCKKSKGTVNEYGTFEDIRNRLRFRKWKIDRFQQKDYCPSCAKKYYLKQTKRINEI